MIIVRISEIRFGGYLVIRKAEIPNELLGKLGTYIYCDGGVLLEEYSNSKEEHYRITAPRLLSLVKELEELLEIKFVEEKGRRVE